MFSSAKVISPIQPDQEYSFKQKPSSWQSLAKIPKEEFNSGPMVSSAAIEMLKSAQDFKKQQRIRQINSRGKPYNEKIKTGQDFFSPNNIKHHRHTVSSQPQSQLQQPIQFNQIIVISNNYEASKNSLFHKNNQMQQRKHDAKLQKNRFLKQKVLAGAQKL